MRDRDVSRQSTQRARSAYRAAGSCVFEESNSPARSDLPRAGVRRALATQADLDEIGHDPFHKHSSEKGERPWKMNLYVRDITATTHRPPVDSRRSARKPYR